ncbi:hypothetical protein B0H65DRAFT_551727 [Neurospora tetraspora]|uniref:Uncharacterized protein n=1 Tax=Neurospora tetraspora TaxID=94610 RepID=A0AAE0MNA6_9PEZI|nr:hypothetical protein B0H65DRAFT_551727 [Neurospora tetraspora]
MATAAVFAELSVCAIPVDLDPEALIMHILNNYKTHVSIYGYGYGNSYERRYIDMVSSAEANGEEVEDEAVKEQENGQTGTPT